MKLIQDEQVIWKSKNDQYIVTTHRIRKYYRTFLKKNFKSIMLENITSVELKTFYELKFLKWSFWSFVIINLAVFLLNNWLFQSKLVQFFFSDAGISGGSVKVIFYFSIVISLALIVLFVMSIQRVFIIHATNMHIRFLINWISFERRETFITMIESQINNRVNSLKGSD